MAERQGNIRVEVDAGDVRFEWTDEEPGDSGEGSVWETLAEAKRQALDEAIPERDSWAQCVRQIRGTTLDDVL